MRADRHREWRVRESALGASAASSSWVWPAGGVGPTRCGTLATWEPGRSVTTEGASTGGGEAEQLGAREYQARSKGAGAWGSPKRETATASGSGSTGWRPWLGTTTCGLRGRTLAEPAWSFPRTQAGGLFRRGGFPSMFACLWAPTAGRSCQRTGWPRWSRWRTDGGSWWAPSTGPQRQSSPDSTWSPGQAGRHGGAGGRTTRAGRGTRRRRLHWGRSSRSTSTAESSSGCHRGRPACQQQCHHWRQWTRQQTRSTGWCKTRGSRTWGWLLGR